MNALTRVPVFLVFASCVLTGIFARHASAQLRPHLSEALKHPEVRFSFSFKQQPIEYQAVSKAIGVEIKRPPSPLAPFGLAEYLNSPEGRSSIEISSAQRIEISELASEIRKQKADFYRKAIDPGKKVGIGDVERLLSLERERVEEILLPLQMIELRRILLKNAIQQYGLRALLSTQNNSSLGLTNEQKEKLELAIERRQPELVRKLRSAVLEHYSDTLASSLSGSKLKSARSLLDQVKANTSGRQGQSE